MGGDSVAGDRMRRYLTRTEARKAGAERLGDLIGSWGIRKGREWERCLPSCEAARLDGLLASAEDEERYLRRSAASHLGA